MPVIGYLSGASNDASEPYKAAFRVGLREAGFVEGQNVTIEYRYAEGHFERLPAMAADLVGRKVNVIYCGGTQATRAAKAATSVIPIVFLIGDDPVEEGFVASLARPRSNVTGSTMLTLDLQPKLLELLRELLPRARRIAMLVDPRTPTYLYVLPIVRETARAMGFELHIMEATSEKEVDEAFGSLAQLHVDALFVFGAQFFISSRARIVALAARHAVPTIYATRDFATTGGLISYGPSMAASIRENGAYVGRILNGASPADLPVIQASVFELVLNLRTARALGLAIPLALLARADDVIE